jgi:hypothetical protein
MRPSLAIQIHRAAIHEIVHRYRGRNPRIFGTAALPATLAASLQRDMRAL